MLHSRAKSPSAAESQFIGISIVSPAATGYGTVVPTFASVSLAVQSNRILAAALPLLVIVAITPNLEFTSFSSSLAIKLSNDN